MFLMFIDHSIDPYMGRSPIGCRARPNICDFNLWGILKENVPENKLHSLEEL
jgi:hypothetical protein